MSETVAHAYVPNYSEPSLTTLFTNDSLVALSLGVLTSINLFMKWYHTEWITNIIIYISLKHRVESISLASNDRIRI